MVLTERELAFIALYKDSYPRIHRFVQRRLDDAELTQELAADVFRIAWQKWDGAAAPDITWLFAVTRNLIGNAYRGRERQRALNEKLAVTSPRGSEDDDDPGHVDEALRSLREKDRDILQLAYWDDLTMAEISQVLGCSQASAKVRLHRAREAFRKQMSLQTTSHEQKVGA
jgi:RNA polymerase sigma factor (sigma-70 family)